jgi:hypothetical protein
MLTGPALHTRPQTQAPTIHQGLRARIIAASR